MAEQPIPKHVLSKSTFLRGCQCTKSLFLYKNQPELRGEISDQQQAIFSQGTNVGELGHQLFPGGVDASLKSPYLYQKSVVYTKKLIDQRQEIIYEAAFQYDSVLAVIDILVKEKGKWKAYEVKSSTEVKDVNILDASLQYYVITQSGITLDDISIVHIDNRYIRQGPLEVNKLFTIQSVKAEVLEKQNFVKEKIDELKSVVSSKEIPATDIGPHCYDPYDCDFIEHCWSHIPEVSVFNLVRLNSNKKFELYQEGIVEFHQIPENYKLSDGQQMQVKHYLSKEIYTDKKSIQEFLSGITYPIYFMDFETFQPAVPLFDNSKPYQQIPFQYSLHLKSNRSQDLIHKDFLADANNKDPRIPFIESLIYSTAGTGTVMTYNKAFEVTRLKEISRDFPKYTQEINALIDRVDDLMTPFAQRMIYHPLFNGSYSIKSVLPALIPELSYDDLEISDGGTASASFLNLYSNTNKEEVEQTRTSLKAYCKLDTFAMVRLLEYMENI